MGYVLPMRVVAVIQARMSSTRLPGKILESLGESTVLEWVVDAARAARLVDDVVVATSIDRSDDKTADFCGALGVPYVRGSLDDLISRYQLASHSTGADAVVRLTADCPLLDPRLIDQCVAVWRADPSIFMATNALVRTYPRGLDVEVLSKNALDWVDKNSQGHHRTHVATLLSDQSNENYVVNLSSSVDNSDLRVTVDTREDLALVRRVVAEVGAQAHDHHQIISLLRAHKDIRDLNGHIQQKTNAEG